MVGAAVETVRPPASTHDAAEPDTDGDESEHDRHQGSHDRPEGDEQDDECGEKADRFGRRRLLLGVEECGVAAELGLHATGAGRLQGLPDLGRRGATELGRRHVQRDLGEGDPPVGRHPAGRERVAHAGDVVDLRDLRERRLDARAEAGHLLALRGGEHGDRAAAGFRREALLEQVHRLGALAARCAEVVGERSADRAGQHRHERGQDRPRADRRPRPAGTEVADAADDAVHGVLL